MTNGTDTTTGLVAADSGSAGDHPERLRFVIEVAHIAVLKAARGILPRKNLNEERLALDEARRWLVEAKEILRLQRREHEEGQRRGEGVGQEDAGTAKAPCLTKRNF